MPDSFCSSVHSIHLSRHPMLTTSDPKEVTPRIFPVTSSSKKNRRKRPGFWSKLKLLTNTRYSVQSSIPFLLFFSTKRRRGRRARSSAIVCALSKRFVGRQILALRMDALLYDHLYSLLISYHF